MKKIISLRKSFPNKADDVVYQNSFGTILDDGFFLHSDPTGVPITFDGLRKVKVTRRVNNKFNLLLLLIAAVSIVICIYYSLYVIVNIALIGIGIAAFIGAALVRKREYSFSVMRENLDFTNFKLSEKDKNNAQVIAGKVNKILRKHNEGLNRNRLLDHN